MGTGRCSTQLYWSYYVAEQPHSGMTLLVPIVGNPL
jgi:hypothetical protein